jgi:Sec-independent protein translocase protein TatA
MSFMELLLIILVALVVIKPERLPEVVKNLSIWFKWFRHASAKLKNELSSVSEQIMTKNDKS